MFNPEAFFGGSYAVKEKKNLTWEPKEHLFASELRNILSLGPKDIIVWCSAEPPKIGDLMLYHFILYCLS